MPIDPKPKRIQRKRTRGWKMPEGVVSVDRATIFGNPYRVTRVKFIPTTAHPEAGEEWHVDAMDGTIYCFKTKREALEAAVKLFRFNVYSEHNGVYRDAVKLELRGKDLACWCPLDQPCHADVLLEIANG